MVDLDGTYYIGNTLHDYLRTAMRWHLAGGRFGRVFSIMSLGALDHQHTACPATAVERQMHLGKRLRDDMPFEYFRFGNAEAVLHRARQRSHLAAVRQVLPQAQVRSAVITVTTDNHSAEPDYALWRDHTLVRFPWSQRMAVRR